MSNRKLREPPAAADASDLAVGIRLRQLREGRRLSRRLVAAGLGVSPQQVEKYETGLTRLSVGRLLRFAAVLEVPPAALLMNLTPGGDGEANPPPGDPAFADACSAFGYLARIRQSGLRDAMLNVLAVLAAQPNGAGAVSLATLGREITGPATKLYNGGNTRRYDGITQDDTIMS
ncbi:helix-turn-helix domain-containing protein [Roseococcus sp. YIM B11640]|uniref:helix-turn-helix domain-containing protein n=1 Tax=Roseococcus sp. YIM B11640 TaxID=3133973 RepID=UPI003C7B1EC6